MIAATEDATTMRTVKAMLLGLDALAEANGAFEAVSSGPTSVVRVLTEGVFTPVGVD